MREIKFRAWDKEEGVMIYVDKPFSDIDVGFHVPSMKLVDELPMMQYTGLKDKNGKEIYEGDIVRLIDEVTQLSIVVYNHHQAAFMLKWIEYYADNEDFMHASYFLEMHPDRVDMEVIGNITENPELLKEA